MGSLPASEDSASPCTCGSRLRRDRCCALDSTAQTPPAAPELTRALAALAQADGSEAERLIVGMLERWPQHVGTLRRLAQLRRAEGAMPAVEALLGRIIRLEPNDVGVTQELALLLFTKGDLVQAEHHARNAVRIAPTDVQSHNLMG